MKKTPCSAEKQSVRISREPGHLPSSSVGLGPNWNQPMERLQVTLPFMLCSGSAEDRDPTKELQGGEETANLPPLLPLTIGGGWANSAPRLALLEQEPGGSCCTNSPLLARDGSFCSQVSAEDVAGHTY
uniref:Uncharacterized protein n=1 Tax=Sphaerodactylus townsendi TaxID=933632 RepID=A0ACB8FKD6_9SAUR